MAPADAVRILLIEDDEDDFLLTQSMLRSQPRARFELDWEQSYGPALAAIHRRDHDLYLIDYRLGERTGLELIAEAWKSEPSAPVVVLTGQDEYEVDLQATELGVTDYLVKGMIDGPSLERTIRYALRQHQIMTDLRRSEERYAVAVRATNDGIWDWELATERMHFSDRWKTLIGYPDFASQPTADAWFALVHPDDVERLREEIESHLAGASAHFESEHRIRHADGGWRWVLTRGLTTRDESGAAIRITGSLSDVTERHDAEQRLIHDALHDSLTGLPNRALFMDRLTQCLGHLKRDPAFGCAVLYLDIDRFKLVNDSLDHAAGDRLLVALARRVEQVLRPGDTLARLGGDEFAILLDGVSGVEHAVKIAERAAQAIGEPMHFERREMSIVASIGIAQSSDGMPSPEELLRNADIAMYDAKEHGGGRCEVFDTSMHQRVLDRVSLETRLRQAIDQGRLRTFFQPIVDLRSGTLHGLEALSRWPSGEPEIPPCDFIPVAEETGLVGPLGALVLRRACEALSRWRRAGLVALPVTISVNVSIRQITDMSFVDEVRAALEHSELPAANLVLEITESTLIKNPELVSVVLAELIALGVAVQLDDFGTGYSSLTVLHDFPGDTLKIDREFVDTMVERPESEAIVRSIVGLAHNLGLRVIAEGIENSEQEQALSGLGCELGQGFYFAPPVAVDELEERLALGMWSGRQHSHALTPTA
jgi:diguanylate cyclase (GGDEF)-like protein/PAS domain S-box-containing protein